MRLSRLELFGFKSFLNRTVFQFGDGITSIVGPNGCGKSNLVDAVIWALGERGTKSLRVKDMGDVIFHGSNGKRPVNLAEVAIEFLDNDREITVKRRIYRDGVNEYYLNGKVVRLKDIEDFFLGTGIGLNSYAIVEQGKIEYFIQMKPLERRVVIAETSGITRFEEKKRDALIRMEEVSANLERVEDVYREVTRSLEKAEAEWHRWKAHKTLADRLNEAEKWILVDGYVKLARKIDRLVQRQGEADGELAKKEEERSEVRNVLAAKDNEFSLIDGTSRQLEVDIKGKEKDMENRLLEIEYLGGERKRLEEELAGFSASTKDLETRIHGCHREIDALLESKSGHGASLRSQEEEGSSLKVLLDGQKAQIEGHEKRVEEERVNLFVSMSTITEIRNRIADMERMEREKQRREEKWAEEKERLTRRAAEVEARLTGLKEGLAREKAARESAALTEQELLGEKDGIAKLMGAKRNVIETLRGEKRGNEEFLRQMASHKPDKASPYPEARKLMDLIKVDEHQEETLERFFFKEMEYFVLSHKDWGAVAQTANQCDGNFIFFPDKGMFRLNSEEVEVKVSWVSTIEDALARIQGGEEGIFINSHVLIDSRGFILKEKDDKRIDLKQFREKKRVERLVKELESKLAGHLQDLKNLQEQYDEHEGAYKDLNGKKIERENGINRMEKEILLLHAELKTTQERLEEIVREQDLLEAPAPHAKESLLQEMHVHEGEKERNERELASLKEHLTSLKASYEKGLSQWHEISLSLEKERNLLSTTEQSIERNQGQIESLRAEMETIRQRVERARGHAAACSDKMDRLREDHKEIRVKCEKDIERYEDLKKTSGDLHMERQALQGRMDAIGREMDRARSRKEAGERELVVLEEKKGTVYERLTTTYGIENPLDLTVPPMGSIEEEREALAREIGDMGEINFRAEKEYYELKERAEFLEKQKEDLRNAMDSLKKTIAKMEHLSREIFAETFDIVNEAFKHFVEMLFKGGKGYLGLAQGGEGVEMYVQPPGKKVIRMEQLSGGEKALVSLAFLLSLMDTKPSPFTLMDEIDAPLDDANLVSLMDIIKEISRKTQIVFITHNRITMESSNTIYGITMEEEGISKTVSVRL
jgi:chromosome segregation protein